MMKIIVLVSALIAVTVAKPALLSAPLVAAPVVTATSSQYDIRVNNAAYVAPYAPVVSAAYAAPYVASPYAAAPYVASPYAAAPYVASPYVSAPYVAL